MPLNLQGLGQALNTGGGMHLGQLGNVDLGSFIQAAQPPPGIQILQGLAQFPGFVQQSMADSADAQAKRMQAKDFEMKVAQNQWDQSVAMLQRNQGLASSPAMIRNMAHLSSVLGYQLPTTSTGAIDPSVYGIAFSDLIKDKDFQQRWWATDPTGRKAMAKAMNIAGVPQEAYTAEPVLTAGEQVLQGKLKLSEVDSADRRKNLDLITQAHAGYYDADSYKTYQQGMVQQQLANARTTDAQAAMKRANDAVYTAKIRADATVRAAEVRARYGGGSGGLAVIRAQLTSAQTAARQAQQAVNQANEAIHTATIQGADEDTMTSLTQQRDTLQQQADAANQNLQQLQTNLGATMDAGASGAVTRQTGKQATVTTQASKIAVPAGTQPVATDPRGAPVYNVGGHYVYKDGSPYQPPQ